MQRPNEPEPAPPREPRFANGRTGAPLGQLTLRDLLGTPAQWRRGLATAAATGLLLGVVGPFGSYLNPSRLTVIAYWIAAILTGEILFGLSVRPATLLAPRFGISPILAVLGVTTIVALPLSLLCHIAAMLLWPSLRGHISRLTFYGQTLLVAFTLAAGHAWVARLRNPTPPAAPPQAFPPIAGDFLSRIPNRLGRDLIALQMEDHYVRVHTSVGSALVLIPMRQALAELGAIPGLRVHRSWWVARHAVTGTVADGRNVRLRLVNGLEAPVSRANVAAVREARLFVGG